MNVSSSDIAITVILPEASVVQLMETLSPQLVIDGQQRLTTVTLLIAALAEALGHDEPVDGFSAKKLRNYYLLNPEETGERHYKLLLSQTDKTSLTAIVAGNEQPENHSIRVTQNFELFEELIAGGKDDLTAICNGLSAIHRVSDTPRAGLQPGELSAHAGDARGDRDMAAHLAARTPDQDRRPARATRPLCRVPDG